MTAGHAVTVPGGHGDVRADIRDRPGPVMAVTGHRDVQAGVVMWMTGRTW
jgi:hypothetical protein